MILLLDTETDAWCENKFDVTYRFDGEWPHCNWDKKIIWDAVLLFIPYLWITIIRFLIIQNRIMEILKYICF